MPLTPHGEPNAPVNAPPARNELRARNQVQPSIITPAWVLDAPARPMAGSSERTVTEVRTLAELEALGPAWQALADAALEPNPFYQPAFALPALRKLGAPGLRVLLAWRAAAGGAAAQRLCGLLPITPRLAAGRIPLPVLELWHHRYCYLCAPLIDADGAAATLRALLDALADACGPNRLLRMPDVPAEGPYHHLLLAELHRRSWASFTGEHYVRAMFRPAESAELYLAHALGGKRRKELRRQRARLAELGPLEVEELGEGGDVERFIREFVALEADGWKGRDGVALAARQADARFFSEMTRAAFASGRLMGLTLRLSGRAIALKHNLLCADTGAAFKITYDEKLARFSPGVLLELENIERLHARPALRSLDSCAAPNRFMINHLWPGRRAVQTLFIAPHRRSALALAMLPLARWASSALRPPAARPEADHD